MGIAEEGGGGGENRSYSIRLLGGRNCDKQVFPNKMSTYPTFPGLHLQPKYDHKVQCVITTE